MRKLVTCLLAALPTLGVLAQCPAILNCPQGSPVICDVSGNDPLLWKDAPYTWSQVLETADLYEGTVDFGIKILPCLGGGNVNVSYTLLLDLDNDNLRETAVWSNALPPPGIVYANNAFNPNYTGGEPAEFDKRTVPDSVKFCFALETSTSWDTLIAQLRWKTGGSFLSPRLPEGRHHLIWRVEQDGTVKYCEHSFRLKDCEPPTLECAPVWSVSLDSNGAAILFLNDILPSGEDNTTPYSLLEFSMRHSGGSGFPLDSSGNPVTELHYSCEELDTQIVEIWAKDRLGNVAFCLTPLTVTDDEGFCEEAPLLCARTFWGNNEIVKPVKFKMLWTDGPDSAQQLVTQPLPISPHGCAEMNFLPPASSFSLTAQCDTIPLNGVSTFDLLLITKHILGAQPFDAPWKWIAADVNQSGSVTTFDVVELRKLILGIYTKLPANTSWRFFAADCDFPPNPFAGYCPSEYSFVTMPLWNYPAEILFNAIKTGDVNGTANPVSFGPATTEARGEPAFLQLPDLMLKAGEVYEIPLQMLEAGEWLGFQFGLQFDLNTVEIEKVSLGQLHGLDENSFAQPEPGTLSFSWFNPAPQMVFPDENLLTVRVKALRAARLQEAVQFKSGWLGAEAYAADEAVHPLKMLFGKNAAATGETAIFPPQPNPTNAGVSVPIRLATEQTASVAVADVSGKTLFQQEWLLESGTQLLELPASAFPQAGVYVWRVRAGEIYCSGKIVRL